VSNQPTGDRGRTGARLPSRGGVARASTIAGALVAALALVVGILTYYVGDLAAPSGGSPSVTATLSPLPTTPSVGASPTGTARPPPPGSSPPRSPDAVVQIQIIQAAPGGASGDRRWLQDLVSLLTALGTLLVGVGALAALRRQQAAAKDTAQPVARTDAGDSPPTAHDSHPKE